MKNYEFNYFFIIFSLITLISCFVITPALISILMPSMLLSIKSKQE